jgi:hypothetical protein
MSNTTPTPRKPAGRAVTEAEKRRLIKRLLLAWLARPDERLGQMIMNATHGSLAPLFYVEDDVLGELLDKARRV